MTNIGLSRRTKRAPAPHKDEYTKAKEAEQSDSGSSWLLPSEIGHVEEGSLEEAIWREIGALPRSRHRKAQL
jgi:hypothetical protein